jgi:DnaJ-class molecular chaperone
MNVEKNYYQILGLTKNATPEEIKKSYKKLAVQYHPDKNNGDKDKETKFKEISEAYSVIGDDNKKMSYDTQSQYGKSYNPNPFSAFGGGQGGFEDIFNTFFRGTGNINNNPFGGTFFGKQHEYREFHENLDINIKDTNTVMIVVVQDLIKMAHHMNVIFVMVKVKIDLEDFVNIAKEQEKYILVLVQPVMAKK